MHHPAPNRMAPQGARSTDRAACRFFENYTAERPPLRARNVRVGQRVGSQGLACGRHAADPGHNVRHKPRGHQWQSTGATHRASVARLAN